MFSFNYVNLCFTLFINMYMHLCRYLRITNFALFLPKGGISPIWDSPEIIDKSDRKPIRYSPGLNIRWSFGNKAFSYSPNASLIPNASLVSVLWWGKAKSHKVPSGWFAKFHTILWKYPQIFVHNYYTEWFSKREKCRWSI